MKKNGAELVVEALKKEGVDTIFAYPGGAVIPIFDVLYSEPEIRVVLTRHEQAAVHAADGYSRSTGKTGICLVTSGPGATNTITGLATANFDSVPIVCISGQVPRNMIGNDAFQEADTVGLTRPVTKHNYLVTDRNELGRIMKEAFFIAGSGRPGPVLVDIPKDIFTAEAGDEYPEEIYIRGFNPVYKGHERQIKKAADALNKAGKPLMFIGGGLHISGAADIFKKIISKIDVPVVSSLMGYGILPKSEKNFLGMIGMHGTYPANMSVMDCDLLFAVGVRFDDRATGDLSKFAPNARIIHIDIDPAAIARNVPVEIPIVGDAKMILTELYPHVKKNNLENWHSQIDLWKNEHPLNSGPKGELLSPENIVDLISKIYPDAIIATEVGQNQMWAALFYQFKTPRSWLTSGGLGTMGYGFPAAVGAQIGNPGKRVIDIAGDGSIQMNIQELATAVQERIPVIIAILNNGYLGMVRQWQEMFHDKRYSSTCLRTGHKCDPDCRGTEKNCPVYSPDFIKLADAYGAAGIRAATLEEAEAALIEASKIRDRPIILDFIIEREANVWPMVPAGAGLDEMLFGEEK